MSSLLNDNHSQSWSTHENETNLSDDATNLQASQPVRKRTRATAEQLSVLEDTFAVNVSPNSKLRKQLSDQLQMSERSIQIWFQNRRAKVKHMQKRAQMQMHQASIRAQLYQYHQQQQQTYGVPPPVNYYFNPSAVNAQRLANSNSNSMTRAQSVDAVQHYHRQQQMLGQPSHPPSQLGGFQGTPPVLFYPGLDARQSMPPYDLNEMGPEFPDYLHGPPSPVRPLKSSATIPTLIPVPDAGPTAVLVGNHREETSTGLENPTEELWISSPDSPHQTPDRAGTVDPSNLMMSNETKGEEEEADDDEEPKDLYLSATTLTVGTWHRLRMNETDLVCVYRPDTRTFAWHIVDGGCHFKMEVAQDAVSSIEYLSSSDALAEVHFDISEPPLFYMESTTVNETDKDKRSVSPVWVQCSDFTEGKQASRFFRHSLKGLQHHLKQELLALIQNHDETRRLVHFTEPPPPTYPLDYPELYNPPYVPSNLYWPHHTSSAPSEDTLLSSGLYIT
ncbi:hypothetical protein BY458DRAFT_493534 [Sporodiniella umbellata]|nr:hypothetical protein BY458DRAFT_493534 [Sporodiniella umbellata]